MNSSKFQNGNFEMDLLLQVTESITPLGLTLQALLKAEDILQRDLARKLGIAPSNLSATLRGRKERPLSNEFVHDISKALNLTPGQCSILEHAARLSITNFSVEMSQPWKYALAARFHHDLVTMTPEIAKAIDALLTTDREFSEEKTHDLIACT